MKRSIALVTAILMILTNIPVIPVFAGEISDNGEIVEVTGDEATVRVGLN